MRVLNFIGPPGTGKSTVAAEMFVHMKKLHLNTEIVTEYAKDKVWEESFAMMENQLYLFGKQQHRLWRVSKKCDIVVTDSPLIFSLYYGKNLSDSFKKLVMEEFNKYDNINIFLNRSHEYSSNGRTQTEDESIEIGKELRDILKDNNCDFVEFEVSDSGIQALKCYLENIGAFDKK